MEGLERMFAARARKHGLDPETMSFGFSCDPPEPGKGANNLLLSARKANANFTYICDYNSSF